jgi:hypothetical protein
MWKSITGLSLVNCHLSWVIRGKRRMTGDKRHEAMNVRALDMATVFANNSALLLEAQSSGAFMYAIIEEGGRQFKVTTGQTILIDRPPVEEKSITLGRVLLVAGE